MLPRQGRKTFSKDAVADPNPNTFHRHQQISGNHLVSGSSVVTKIDSSSQLPTVIQSLNNLPDNRLNDVMTSVVEVDKEMSPQEERETCCKNTTSHIVVDKGMSPRKLEKTCSKDTNHNIKSATLHKSEEKMSEHHLDSEPSAFAKTDSDNLCTAIQSCTKISDNRLDCQMTLGAENKKMCPRKTCKNSVKKEREICSKDTTTDANSSALHKSKKNISGNHLDSRSSAFIKSDRNKKQPIAIHSPNNLSDGRLHCKRSSGTKNDKKESLRKERKIRSNDISSDRDSTLHKSEETMVENNLDSKNSAFTKTNSNELPSIRSSENLSVDRLDGRTISATKDDEEICPKKESKTCFKDTTSNVNSGSLHKSEGTFPRNHLDSRSSAFHKTDDKELCAAIQMSKNLSHSKLDGMMTDGEEICPRKKRKTASTNTYDNSNKVNTNSTDLQKSEDMMLGSHLDRVSLASKMDSKVLPPAMQSSNDFSDNRLDITYDGGGLTTSDAEEGEMCSMKKEASSIIASNDNYNESNTNSEDRLYIDTDDDDDDDSCSASFKSETNCKKKIGFTGDDLGDMEFDILDEFEDNDDENDNDNDNDADSDCCSDISLEELDELLDAGLNNKNLSDNEVDEKEKTILKVRGRDHFDVLPEGWIEVTHNSGMPVYLHKVTRVCCVSKPYFLGPGSIRKHEIPISAIPCLHYLKELEKEKAEAAQKEKENEDGEPFPSAKLESVKETKEMGSLDPISVREYCMKRFEFQTIKVKRFKTWSGRRKHQKALKLKQRPSLPDSTKLITCPLPPIDRNNMIGHSAKREFVMNPSGKSPVCILHEYVQHTLRVQPKYVFKELENASTPYGAVVIINDMEYGAGYGSSKKQAKSAAAKAALEVLIPNMRMFSEFSEEHQDVEFFDQVRIQDPRVCDLSVKAGQPYPYQILLECLKRNYGMGDTEIYINMKNLKHQKNEFMMSVGKHSVSVICKNKRDGKHRASQAILQLLHPHITSWGSLLRMYGKGSFKTLKEKKEEEQRITELQSQACANKPNLSILNKLKEEMLKYRERMKARKPIGKLIPEQMNFSTSDSNLKNVEL